MRHFRLFALLLSLSLAAPVVAQSKASQSNPAKAESATTGAREDIDSSSRLPVKRVVLYKNGVGYFEHTARVRGTQELNIDFTTAQLNDVLKSLTAVDLGDGRISSVRYNSIAPLDERLKSLRLPFGEQVTQAEYLTALRGARVEVRSGSTTATGRLLSVERIRRQRGKDDFEDVTSFSVITDAGEMRSFDLGPGTSVRIAERELTEEVGRYLGLIGSSRARDVRRMSFTASGSGERDIFVSYISEVPIWKSTYRILISDKPGEKPLLQGWAIVDNTIGEDWKDVELSLIAGAPQSFVQNISQPYYARRPEIPLPESAMLTPQSHEATVEGEGVGSGAGGGIAAAMGGPSRGITAQNGALQVPLMGRNSDQMAKLFHGIGDKAATVQTESANISAVAGNLGSEAEGKSAGDFFEYKIKQKITIGKNQSALVPILQSHIEAEKVTLWNRESAPLLALWVKNTGGQVLDSGSFDVLEANTFAGEGVLETIHPDERRLLSYAGDAAVHVKYADESSEKPYSRIRIMKGIMTLTKEQHNVSKYTVRNADTDGRQVIVECPAQEGWKLVPGTAQPEESSESYYRFRIPVEAGKMAELTVETVHPEQETYELTNLDDDEVELLVQQQRMTPAMKQAFDGLLKQKEKISDLAGQINQRKAESDQIGVDQNRIRENMKALKGSPEEKALLQRYVGQLDSQENRLTTLRKEMADLTAQRNAADAELDRMIQEVNLDASF
jgi:hypothetical protein